MSIRSQDTDVTKSAKNIRNQKLITSLEGFRRKWGEALVHEDSVSEKKRKKDKQIKTRSVTLLTKAIVSVLSSANKTSGLRKVLRAVFVSSFVSIFPPFFCRGLPSSRQTKLFQSLSFVFPLCQLTICWIQVSLCLGHLPVLFMPI